MFAHNGRPLLMLLLLVVAGVACGEVDQTSPQPQPAVSASIESIETADGLRLDARLFEAAPERLVILLHMFPADQSAWFDVARELQADGWISALTLDFRGFGASEGSRDVGKIDRDVRAALTFARGRGYRSIALVGASMGGTAAIMVAADDEGVAAVITLSAPVRFRGLDAVAVVDRVAAPLTALAARGDTSAADSLETFAARAGLDERHALLFDGRAHGTDMLTADNGEQVRARLRALLDEIWPR